MRVVQFIFTLKLFSLSGFAALANAQDGFAWHAGDHHIHSRYSVGWNRDAEPPSPVIGGDAIYPIHMNALMAKYYGLSWMVATDHGGPNHSKVNFEMAYPELLQSRLVVPEVVQFYGMEFDTPGADHSSLIIPFTDDEAEKLVSIESRFAKREPWPANPSWDAEPRMLEALAAMQVLSPPPLLIANHPSRSATGFGDYGLDTPSELRDWNDTAPEVAVGMAGAPGHQAGTLNPDGSADTNGARGGYGNYPTIGGFDQFTATVGGFWDSMLGEGRNWWITANSDSHVHYSEGGSDFWPGEYSKTYVFSEKNHDSIMAGIRSGKVFVTTGDLINELYVSVSDPNQPVSASIGDDVKFSNNDNLTLTIRFRDPDTNNHNGDNPSVTRVDLIIGDIGTQVTEKSSDTNPSTKVLARFTANDWKTGGNYKEISYQLPPLTVDSYIRVRGTNTAETEPMPDPRGENPWQDLWFYSNPIRLRVN